MANYRILSIDGGGIRGLISTILLQRILAEPGMSNLLDSTDLLAGTSTGGLIALGIAHGLDLQTIRDVYEKKGPVIFADTVFDNIRDLGKLRGADYSIVPLKKELVGLFQNTTLGGLKKRVLISTFQLDNRMPSSKRTWKPKLFHNFTGSENDRSASVVKVGLYTSAAPTFFPSVDGYIDGGVYASNPSMCALAQSQDKRYKPTPALDDVRLFSLGTGTSLEYISRDVDWGLAQWAKPLIRLMFDGVSGIADYQCYQLLHEHYHRLAPVFPPRVTIPMDAVKPRQMKFMVNFASTLPIANTVKWLKEYWI